MHKRGASMTDIGAELGVSRQRVAQLGARLGLVWAKAPTEKERKQRLPALLRQGLTDEAIAEHLGVHPAVVSKDVRSMRGHKRLRQEQRQARPGGQRRAQIPKLIQQGLSAPAIAKRLDVVTSTIYRDLVALNLPKHLHQKRLDNGMAAKVKGLRRAAKARRKR